MKLSNKYKSSEYILLFSILVLALLLGTYFSFYAFLWRDIDSKVTGFSKTHYMNYYEGMKSSTTSSCPSGYVSCLEQSNYCQPMCIKGNTCGDSNACYK